MPPSQARRTCQIHFNLWYVALHTVPALFCWLPHTPKLLPRGRCSKPSNTAGPTQKARPCPPIPLGPQMTLEAKS